MYQLSNEIIALAVILGIVLAVISGSSSKNTSGFIFVFATLGTSVGISIVTIILASLTQEICEKKLNICLGTNHSNVWNFVLFPVLCIPIYFIAALLSKNKNR